MSSENKKYSQQEIRTLLQKCREGDLRAREQLLTSNFSLVHSIVRRYCVTGHNDEDLFQAGCIGLINAIDRFDLSYDVCFSTYAVPLILGEIRRFIREDRPLKVSRQLRERAMKIDRFRHELYITSGNEPTLADIAERCELSPEQAIAAMDAFRPPLSIHESRRTTSGESGELGDVITSRFGSIDDDTVSHIQLRQALGKIPKRLSFVVQCRYFVGMTQKEVAEKLGVTQVQISRLEKQALTMIRKSVDDAS